MALTGKQRSYLRGLAHHINPVVLTGAAGVTEAVVDKVKVELENHELIKVKVGEGPDGARDLAYGLSESVDAELVQVIGHVVVLYRKRDDKPEIKLPKAR